MDDYPAVKTHLENFWDSISKRADMGDTPYNLRNCAYMEDFSKPKIIYGQFRRGEFAYDASGFYLSSNEYFISSTTLNLYYLLGILNSKVYNFYGNISMNRLGNATTIAQKDHFINFPLLKPSPTSEKEIIHYVKEILSCDVLQEEKEKDIEKINLLLYSEYRLTDEEIQIMETL